VQSRWLTTASRILRYYISSKKPTEELRLSATYIARVYAFVWFSIKKFPNISEGSKHLWKVIELSRFLPPEARRVIEETIQFNAFFGHHENLLLAMATDPSPEVRSVAWRRMKKSRKMPKMKGVREFRVPKLNTDARNYTEMINWQTCDHTEPPLTMKLSDQAGDRGKHQECGCCTQLNHKFPLPHSGSRATDKGCNRGFGEGVRS